jgi:hypothetical protein
MKFSSISTLFLISSTLAAPLVVEKRDDKMIRDSLVRITDATKDVTRFLKDHYHPQGKEGFFNEGIQRQRNLNRVTRDENIRISRAPSLSSLEWYGLGSLTFPLGTALMDCANAWIGLRDSSGFKDQEILITLQESLSDGLAYADALWTKTNMINGAITNQMKSQIGTTWNKAINAYKSSSSFGGYNPGDYGVTGGYSGGSSGGYQGGSSRGYQGGNQGGYQGGDQGGFGGNQGGFGGDNFGYSPRGNGPF